MEQIDKEKLLEWIEMRINENKEKVNEIYDREFSGPHDWVNHHYYTGARSELVFLRKCIKEHGEFKIEG
jgi:hypothetical protein